MLSKMLRGSVNNTTNPTVSDANFKQVSLLLHGDGTNGAQNNTFLDSSTNNFTVTRNGNTTQGTNTPFSQAVGYWSNNFNGTTDYLSLPTSSSFTFGTNSWTVESWINASSLASEIDICGLNSENTGGYCAIRFLVLTDGSMRLLCSTGSSWINISTTSAGVITTETWYHVAAVRNGSTFTIYVNGVSKLTYTSSSALSNTNAFNTVGCHISSNSIQYPFGGYISNFRVVNGTAVYTSAFTPSTTPLTAITNTSLLTCQSSYFKDNSSNNFAITATGTPSVQPFSPFAPTSAYSTSVNGGSMYFDGTGDYLSVPYNAAFDFNSGNFTVEFYAYINSLSNSPELVQINQDNATAFAETRINVTSAGAVYFLCASNVINNWISVTTTANGVVTAGAWYHIAAVRNGSTFTLYVNGVNQLTYTSSDALRNTSGASWIGALQYPSTGSLYDPLNGILSNVRVVKGTAVYTANFTPPTAPLTAITNTSLLLSGTNAGIYDNAIKNDLETVGSAQVSTSVVKYGTGSMSFNGTTDYLNPPTSPQFAFGTGNWTIEGWVYPSSVTALQSLIDTRATATSTSGVLVSITALGFISVTVNNAILFTSSTAMTLSTWTHVAIVQNGTTITLYLDGTKPTTGSGTSSTSLTDQYLRLGASAGTAANFYNGYLDDVRITKGIARYTANFTAPTAAFPNQ